MLSASARLPSRATLASAIERHRDAEAQLARIEAAVQKISESRIEDHTSIGRARNALTVARHGRSEILIAQALNEPAPDLPDPAECERVLAEAEAHLDNSRSALKTLEAEAERARSTLGLADRALNRAIEEVVAADAATARLHAEFTRTMASAARLWRALRTAGESAVNIVGRLDGDDPAWSSALLALRENPDAVLPDLPPDEPLDHARAGGRKAA